MIILFLEVHQLSHPLSEQENVGRRDRSNARSALIPLRHVHLPLSTPSTISRHRPPSSGTAASKRHEALEGALGLASASVSAALRLGRGTSARRRWERRRPRTRPKVVFVLMAGRRCARRRRRVRGLGQLLRHLVDAQISRHHEEPVVAALLRASRGGAHLHVLVLIFASRGDDQPRRLMPTQERDGRRRRARSIGQLHAEPVRTGRRRRKRVVVVLFPLAAKAFLGFLLVVLALGRSERRIRVMMMVVARAASETTRRATGGGRRR